jgi:hypothetical protein
LADMRHHKKAGFWGLINRIVPESRRTMFIKCAD